VTEPTIRKLLPDEWALLRHLRLEALQESPSAFGSTFERELGFDEATWRSRLETSAFFVAESGDDVLGMACAFRPEPHGDDPSTMQLVSMWVSPRYRRRGVGSQLVSAVLEYARARGESKLGLCVAVGNEPAVTLYRAAGFEPTGEMHAMQGRPGERELHMTASL
jgi:ribosomal protein S18 acetylase RimI-like enzyme